MKSIKNVWFKFVFLLRIEFGHYYVRVRVFTPLLPEHFLQIGCSYRRIKDSCLLQHFLNWLLLRLFLLHPLLSQPLLGQKRGLKPLLGAIVHHWLLNSMKNLLHFSLNRRQFLALSQKIIHFFKHRLIDEAFRYFVYSCLGLGSHVALVDQLRNMQLVLTSVQRIGHRSSLERRLYCVFNFSLGWKVHNQPVYEFFFVICVRRVQLRASWVKNGLSSC